LFYQENDDGGKSYGIKVVDSGIGIKDEDKPKLFKIFGRLHNSSHINSEGVGLGLTICKAIVEQLGGSITLESEYGVGTTIGVMF
jgi:signal transduction histidine kinase